MALIDPRLLAILVCPRCKGQLEEAPLERALYCPRCDRAFLVNREGVPIMTVEDE